MTQYMVRAHYRQGICLFKVLICSILFPAGYMKSILTAQSCNQTAKLPYLHSPHHLICFCLKPDFLTPQYGEYCSYQHGQHTYTAHSTSHTAVTLSNNRQEKHQRFRDSRWQQQQFFYLLLPLCCRKYSWDTGPGWTGWEDKGIQWFGAGDFLPYLYTWSKSICISFNLCNLLTLLRL